VGLGLTDRVAPDAVFWSDGSLWALIRGDGRYEAWLDGVSVAVLADTAGAPGFAAGGFNQLEVIYDNDANRVWVLINGTVVLDGQDLGAAAVPISGAGLHLFADGGEADDFELNLLPLWSTRAGDFDGSRALDTQDINPFILAMTDRAAYAQAYPGLRLELLDLSGDGVINTEDINHFVAALTAAQGQVIPQPAGVTLLLVALLAMTSGRSGAGRARPAAAGRRRLSASRRAG
jgi:hypothetical protein